MLFLVGGTHAQEVDTWRLATANADVEFEGGIPAHDAFVERPLSDPLETDVPMWLRLSPQAEACEGIRDAVLSFRNGYFQRFTLHWQTGSGWQSLELGTRPGAVRPFSGRRPAAHLPGYNCGEPLYVGYRHPFALTLRPDLDSYDPYLQAEFTYLRWISLFFSTLVALALYNLFVAWRLKERVFATYSAYLLSVLGFFYFQEGLPFREYSLLTDVGTRFTSIFSALCVYFTLLFVEQFTRADLLAPKLARMGLRWPRYPLLLAAILIAVTPDSMRWIGANIVGYLSLYCSPMVLVTAAVCWYRGSIAGGYVTVAWSGVLLAVAYRVMSLMGVFELNEFALYGVQAGATFEAIVLAFGLAHVVSTARRERDAAQSRLIKEQSLRMHQEFLADFRSSLDKARRVEDVWTQVARAFRRLFRANSVTIWESTGDLWQPAYSSIDQPAPAPGGHDQMFVQKSMGKLVQLSGSPAAYGAWLHLATDHALFIRMEVQPGHVPLKHEAEFFIDYAGPLLNSLKTLEYIDSIRDRMQRDSLTGAYSRDYLRQKLAEMLAASDADISILYCDLDHFKQINDDHGHAAGDDILVRFVETVNARLADSDWLVRLGGEEFLCVTERSAESAVRLANAIRTALDEKPIAIGEQEFRLTVSVGVATAREGDTVDDLLERADRAMYSAKKAGRNRVVMADS